MRNLLIFISKYNAFFLFLIFEVSALIIYIKYNSFQKATFVNSSNQVTGNIYGRISKLNQYLRLKDVNDSLVQENARLRGQLASAFYGDTATKHTVTDTVYHQQYTYIAARVINNSVNRPNNYITINRGTDAGIAKDMGVICSAGIVGIVVNVSQHFATIRSFLHKDTKVSAMLGDTKDIGSMIWSEDLGPNTGLLIDIQNHVKPHLGETVVTSGFSLWPAGIPIGKISNLKAKGGGFFLNMEVALAVDYSRLQYVYVVNNKLALEQANMEAQQKKDEQDNNN
ncbi:rod shape-determining protein MreC [Mucilaginibacter sp. RS28]|uniref:Cell shape-determining protein MreC n=1 Tax=Mucilaginibacter straminoryzae TaxID=2932774 RepID=A0A9X1WZK5_9SPHI|nr:rod shape-determining protein MreC [Mucilaginibacter straminoryzae]MCJ8208542.1 rod shape-determining protein MreC [Mucilaginibacter straminoryzae]